MRPAEAQFTKRLTERIKQKVAEKKMQTEEAALNNAAQPADSAMARVAAPVETLTARAGGAAGSAVAGVGRRPDEEQQARVRLREELAAGRADLLEVRFEPGTAALAAASEGPLRSLAAALTESPGAFLVQGRADPGAAPGDAPGVASARAAGVKAWLVGYGIPAERIFAAGDGAAAPGRRC